MRKNTQSIHEVSTRYLIPGFHSCKNSVSKIKKKAIAQNKRYDFFFQFFTKFSIHHPLSADTSFKFLGLILFQDTAFTKLHPLFLKGP